MSFDNIILTVQMFNGLDSLQGIEEIGKFECGVTCIRTGINTWEISPLQLFDLYREFLADTFDWLRETPEGSTFERRFKGALMAAMKETGGWSYWPSDKNTSIIQRSDRNKTLSEYGCIAIRYVCDENNNHVSIDLRFQDGTEIICPSRCKVLWGSHSFIISHLNSIKFEGGGWTDKSNWSCFDHLLSHGH